MSHTYLTTAMYHFVSLPHFKTLREPLLQFCLSRDIKGTLLLADEGINGTVAGSEKSILELLNYLKNQVPPVPNKFAVASSPPTLSGVF